MWWNRFLPLIHLLASISSFIPNFLFDFGFLKIEIFTIFGFWSDFDVVFWDCRLIGGCFLILIIPIPSISFLSSILAFDFEFFSHFSLLWILSSEFDGGKWVVAVGGG